MGEEFEGAEYTVEVELLNIRAKPSKRSKVVKLVKRGQTVRIVAEQGKWGELADGEGFVMLEYVERME